jgi:deazaflavin-dependent oxidoreductase (nitroreductase family)
VIESNEGSSIDFSWDAKKLLRYASSMAEMQQPSGIERFFNKLMGFAFRKGWAPEYGHELEVVGRSSGRVYKTPVNLLRVEGRLYLVAPRGETQWVKNARAAGTVGLTRGGSTKRYRVTELEVQQRPKILAAYLKAYSGQVQRFFSVKAGSPIEAFAGIAAQHPVFELSAAD